MKALWVKRIAEWSACVRPLAIGLMLWLNLQVGAMLPVPGVRAGEKNVAPPAAGRHSWPARSTEAGWKPALQRPGAGIASHSGAQKVRENVAPASGRQFLLPRFVEGRPGGGRYNRTPYNSFTPSQARLREAFGNLPLSFEANQGQANASIRFLSHGPGYSLFLTPDEAILVLSSRRRPEVVASRNFAFRNPQPEAGTFTETLHLKLAGANASPRLTARSELPARTSYFIGDDPEKWFSGVPNFSSVEYKNVYSGIDLIYYGDRRRLEHDFIVHPGARPKDIRLDFKGARHIRLDGEGNLLLAMMGGEVILQAPLLYQEWDGVRREISGGYRLRGNSEVSFDVGAYDAGRALIIDPKLAYGTYFGGSLIDGCTAIAVDSGGNIFVAGETASTNFPVKNSIAAYGGGDTDAFVAKLDPTGSSLLYSTYVGGSAADLASGIAVDAAGNAYVTGQTKSVNFPMMTPLQPVLGGGQDAFVLKLNAQGSALLYSTYLGGGTDDSGNGVTVDASGNAYVSGQTASTNFPLKNPFQSTYGGGDADAFVCKINPAGSALIYSSYLGGNGQEGAFRIAVDKDGNAYITGPTASRNFPLQRPVQGTYGGGDSDVFVSKVNAAGSALVYSTFLGGTSLDFSLSVAVDGAGSAYIAGFTTSTNFPVQAPFQRVYAGGGTGDLPAGDAFVTKLSPDGSTLVYSTYLGGKKDDAALAIAVDPAGNAYVTGFTSSTDFPIKNSLKAFAGGSIGDAFVAKLNSTGSDLIYSTYLGGAGDDLGLAIAADAAGSAYVCGVTTSTDFPRQNPLQSTYGGGDFDGFIAKITEDLPPVSADLSITKSSSPGSATIGTGLTYTISVSNAGPSTATGVTVTDTLPAGVTFVSASSAQGSCSQTGGTVTCNLGSLANAATVGVSIVVTPTTAGIISNTAVVRANESDPSTLNNSASVLTSVTQPPTQFTLYLAHFGNGAVPGAQLFSQILLFNLDPLQSVSAKISIRDDQGNLLSVTLNGEKVLSGEKNAVVPAGGLQVLKTDGQGPLVGGAVTVVSDRPLSGVILFGGTIGLDGVGSSQAFANGFVAPMESNTAGGIDTGVAIMNLEPGDLNGDLQLTDAEGKLLASARMDTIKGNGHMARFGHEFNWSPRVDFSNFSGLLRVNTTGRCAATVLQTRLGEIATMPVAPRTLAGKDGSAADVLLSAAGGPDFSLPSRADSKGAFASPDNNLYFAHFGNGAAGVAQIFSQIVLFNLDPAAPVNASVSIRDDLGNPLAVNLNGELITGLKSLTIPPGGLRVLKTNAQGPISVGSVTVSPDRPLVGVLVFGGSFGVAGVGSSQALDNGFVAPMETSSSQGISTGVALMNLEGRDIGAELKLLDSGGNVVATARLDGKDLLKSNGHSARFIQEFIWSPAVDFSSFVGLLKVIPAGRIAATVLQVRPNQFATMPVAAIAAGAPTIVDVKVTPVNNDSAKVDTQFTAPGGEIVKLEFTWFRQGAPGAVKVLNSPADVNLTGLKSGTVSYTFTGIGVPTPFGTLSPDRVDVQATDARGLKSNVFTKNF
ncbi:MAG TPA: SBBP repeat-containing protein [Acidobacteriota bacterium]